MSGSRDGARSGSVPLAALSFIALAAALLIGAVVLMWTGVLRVAPLVLQTVMTRTIVGLTVLYFGYLLFAAALTRIERLRVLALVVLFVASVLFFAGYEQTGSSLNLFAERYTNRHLFGGEIPASWFQSLNPIFIVVFGTLFSALWVWLARRNREPSTPLKFIAGLLGMGAGFLVMAAASRLVAEGHMVGMGWLSITYLLHTWGELCLSPVGLSASTKLVPARFTSQSLGIFLVSLSVGNLLAGRIAGDIDATNLAAMPGQFMFIFWYAAISAALLALMMPLLRRWMAGVQ
jgi:POT family proton-dependent oligopeptide transporter